MTKREICDEHRTVDQEPEVYAKMKAIEKNTDALSMP